MSRISREQMFMDMAHIAAKRATCQRLNVGAVVVRGINLLSIGYNGAKSGEEHCTGERCSGWIGGCKRAIHAEINALSRIPEGVRSTNLELYCTDSPCADCWSKIEQDGRVFRVYFSTPYRIMDHLMVPSPVELYRVLPSGAVIDWRNNKMIKQ